MAHDAEGAVPLVLAADVGGTNCRMALFQGATIVEQRQVPSRGPGLAHALLPFLQGQKPMAACIAVAGPVREGHAALTNHHWVVRQDTLAEAIGCPVVLVNDFEAAARGVPELAEDGWRALQDGVVSDGPIAVLGPGTGLGQALLVPSPGGWLVLPSQGGHVDFGPTDDEEIALLRFLGRQHRRVSYEHILSGAGLVSLHAFYLEQGRAGSAKADPAHVVASADPAARAAVRRFAAVLGAQAGNVALATLARGGVYLCGGIPPRLDLEGSRLLEQFHAKGRMAELMPDFPLRLVTDPHLGLRGAAALARERAV
ncbi:MAG: glucokinase [Alphaproteobacteria bacterium]|nr:glucokinase [Alphaproteobacteria bacterium]